MGVTYESICEKLGFDPINGGNPRYQERKSDSWLIDDSIESPYSVLTQEESDFLWECFKKRKSKSFSNRSS